MEKIIISNKECGLRLDVFLSNKLDITRSQVKKNIEENSIFINDKKQKTGYILKENDIITYEISNNEIDLTPKNIPINIVYEDKDIIIINKPQGLVVHPSISTPRNTLVNALLFHYPNNLSDINGKERPGIVHRLDKDTSGLMVVAKNNNAHKILEKQIQTKECKRVYWALVEGIIKNENGIINKNLIRDPNNRTAYTVCNNNEGRNAITHYKLLKQFKDTALMEFELKTGRTHQIRVHSKFLGHPIVGDKTYGYKKQKFNLNGQLLHSKTLILTHPTTNKIMRFDSELPDYFQAILDKLEKQINI